MSQSELQIIFKFIEPGAEKVLTGRIIRLQSPLIVQAIMDKAPFICRTRGNIGSPKSYWIFMVDIARGPEKQLYKQVVVGDIVYCPRQDSLFVFHDKEHPPISDQLFYIGKIESGLEVLKTVRNGTNARVEIKELS
jgi:hypothetical protein